MYKSLFFYLKIYTIKIRDSAEKFNFGKGFRHYKKVQNHCIYVHTQQTIQTKSSFFVLYNNNILRTEKC